MSPRTQREIQWELATVNPRERRLHRRAADKRRQRRRDVATACSLLGVLILGLATLAWYVVLPAALVLLGIGMWGTR